MSVTGPDFAEPLHSVGERVLVPSFAMRQALAWWIVAEFIRRHPKELRVVEEQLRYGLAITLVRRGANGFADSKLAVFLTLGADTHLTPGCDWSAGRFNWLDVLLAADRRAYVVEQLERVLDLSPPRSTPATQVASIGPRLISAYLDRTTLGPTRWMFLNGVTVDEDDAVPAERLFEKLPDVSKDRGFHLASHEVWRMVESRYWFLCPVNAADEAGAPVAALDVVAGKAWNEQGMVDLLATYRRLGNKIDALASRVFPPTH